jgi:RimJ/RimL family protein N-acetyltransferase
MNAASGPVVLQGNRVRLEPLDHVHADGVLAAAADSEIWRYMAVNLDSPQAVAGWIDGSLALVAQGTDAVFTIVEQATNRVIGSTRYLDIRPAHRGLEIGWTWLAKDQWRTGVNTECKFLLLQHAFETLDAIRVQLKTHRLNFRSRRAIERIGAQFEGILRNAVILADGTFRDSAYYSITDAEWPAVRRHLQMMMGADGSPDD